MLRLGKCARLSSTYRCRAYLCGQYRSLLTLAIETSCDDTSVAILERPDGLSNCKLHFHEKVTADNHAFQGIHPGVAIASHQRNLAELVNRSLQAIPTCHEDIGIGGSIAIRNSRNGHWVKRWKPNFVSVTRGPGISTALSTGLETAKGLAVAWQVPIVGIHHMQAHALTPRLAHALTTDAGGLVKPSFPFLSLLVSGGHTLLVHSKSLCAHGILASTADIAVGDALDKMARSILPPERLAAQGIMYGRTLEQFAFENGITVDQYTAPPSRAEEIAPRNTQWGWALPVPLANTRDMSFSFTGVGSAVKRICDEMKEHTSDTERRELAQESMRVVFEHLASRVVFSLQSLKQQGQIPASVVVSGGVASNKYLRLILRSMLKARGFSHVELVCPPLELCTDNAAMIAWAGMEMYDQGFTTELSSHAIRKWSLDPQVNGGILGADGWIVDGQAEANL